MLVHKLIKSEFDSKKYAELASWCNANNHKIIDTGDAYEAVSCVQTEQDLNEQKKQQLQKQITDINYKLAQLQGISLCAVSVDGVNEYDVFKDDELVTMSETEFQNYFDELSDKRSDLLQQYKELDNGTTND